MSNKKPLGDKTINQQEIESIFIDTNNEIIVVHVKVYLEESNKPEDGQTKISNITIVKKQLSFSDVPNINGILTSIENQV